MTGLVSLPYKYYYENGSLASEANYEHDNMIGEPKHF